MELEYQVTSLEISKKLKAFGVKQESLWYWQKPWSGPIDVNPDIYRLTNNPHKVFNKEDEEGKCSAFTVAELGELLPENIYTKQYLGKRHPTTEENKDYIEHMKANNWYAIECDDNMDNLIGYRTEADARGKMLIYLINNGMMGGEDEKII